jgi:hypothetical protein
VGLRSVASTWASAQPTTSTSLRRKTRSIAESRCSEGVTTAPDFRRRIVRRRAESVVVVLVRDRAPQVKEKQLAGSVRLDSPEEILANKLCTLPSRTEARDLTDVMALEAAGFRVDNALPLAQQKDDGLTPAQLAWVLSTFPLAELQLPAGADRELLSGYLADPRSRLTRAARP